MLSYSGIFRKAVLFPLVWALTHATLVIWQAIDPGYLKWAEWVAINILTPLHPMIVWLVKQVVPALETFMSNTKPTHHDAPKVFYPVFMALYGIFGTLAWIGIRKIFFVFGTNLPADENNLAEQRQKEADVQIYQPVEVAASSKVRGGRKLTDMLKDDGKS